jgi:hypothetical protein
VSRLKPAYSAASDTFNQGFMVHLARRVCASSQLLPNVHKVARSGALAYGRRAGNSGARCGLMLPASKTGTLSVAVVARHVVVRPEAKWVTLAALFSRMARRYSHASVVHRSRMP